MHYGFGYVVHHVGSVCQRSDSRHLITDGGGKRHEDRCQVDSDLLSVADIGFAGGCALRDDLRVCHDGYTRCSCGAGPGGGSGHAAGLCVHRRFRVEGRLPDGPAPDVLACFCGLDGWRRAGRRFAHCVGRLPGGPSDVFARLAGADVPDAAGRLAGRALHGGAGACARGSVFPRRADPGTAETLQAHNGHPGFGSGVRHRPPQSRPGGGSLHFGLLLRLALRPHAQHPAGHSHPHPEQRPVGLPDAHLSRGGDGGRTAGQYGLCGAAGRVGGGADFVDVLAASSAESF